MIRRYMIPRTFARLGDGRRRRRILSTFAAAGLSYRDVYSVERSTRRTWLVGCYLRDDLGQKARTADGLDLIRYVRTISGGRL